MKYLSVCSGVEAAHEEWRDVAGTGGKYRVSNLGRVARVHGRRTRILNLGYFRTGYLRVTISVRNIHKTVSVHRLVANAFIENPANLPCVNHKDEDKTNNNVSNLEWCDHKTNNSYGTRLYRVSCALSRPIFAVKDGVEREFRGLTACAKELGLNVGHICEILHGSRSHCHGYTFRYKEIA